jgi:hypothetical protein
MGHFVRPQQWSSIAFQRLHENPNHHDLRVLSHVLMGSDPESLAGHLEDTGLLLQEDAMCLTRNVGYIFHRLKESRRV